MGAASHLPFGVSQASHVLAFWLVILLIWAAIELNAVKGVMFSAIDTVRAVTMSGVALTFILVSVVWMLL